MNTLFLIKKKSANNSVFRGFTLIELLVVIAIIGLLSSVVLASLNSARIKGRDARRLSDLHQIQLGLQLYYQDNGHYPASGGTWWYSCDTAAWNQFKTALAVSFPSQLPVDPINTSCGGPWNVNYYTYTYGSNGGDKYDLVTALEQSGSPLSCGVKRYKYHDWGGESVWCTAGGGVYWDQLYADH